MKNRADKLLNIGKQLRNYLIDFSDDMQSLKADKITNETIKKGYWWKMSSRESEEYILRELDKCFLTIIGIADILTRLEEKKDDKNS